MIEWSETDLLIRDSVRAFIDKEVRPNLDALESGQLPPYPILRKLFADFGIDVLAAEARPTLIKPNRAELEAWADTPLPDTADIVASARSLLGRGLEQVVVSMGADGALFITDGAALHASLPAIRPSSTVGAGDAMVAGIVAALAEAAAPDRMARLGAAFAYSKLGQIGPNLGTRGRVEALAAQACVQALD